MSWALPSRQPTGPGSVPGEWEGIRVTRNVFTTVEEIDRFSAAIRLAATKGI